MSPKEHELIDLWQAGISVRDISKKLNMTPARVRSRAWLIRRRGIDLAIRKGGSTRGAVRKGQRIKVNDHIHPLVKELFSFMTLTYAPITSAADRSGVEYATISSWRKNCNPYLQNFEAVVNAMGGKLVIVWN